MKGLKTLRRSRGMTQEDLARAAGFDQYSVSQWERGRRSPRPTTVRKLAEALGVEPQDLFVEQPLLVPLAEPAPAEDVAEFLRSRCGNDFLVMGKGELVIRAMDPNISVPEMMDRLDECRRAAREALREGGLSREMRAALKEAAKPNNFLDRLGLLEQAGIRKVHEEAERLRQEANVSAA